MRLPLTYVHSMHWDYVANSMMAEERHSMRIHLDLLTNIKTGPEVCYQKLHEPKHAKPCQAVSLQVRFETWSCPRLS